MTQQPKLTEKLIQSQLYWWLRAKGYGDKDALLVPNFTADNWWEADVWAVTKANFGWEFEIKVSKGDFRNDSRKTSVPRHRYYSAPIGRFNGTKYEAMEASHKARPNRFSYVTPWGLLQPHDIPRWAGHIESVWDGWKYVLVQVKPAPLLHRERVPEGVKDRARRAFYYRFWALRTSERCPEQGEPWPEHVLAPVLEARRDRLWAQYKETGNLAMLVAGDELDALLTDLPALFDHGAPKALNLDEITEQEPR